MTRQRLDLLESDSEINEKQTSLSGDCSGNNGDFIRIDIHKIAGVAFRSAARDRFVSNAVCRDLIGAMDVDPSSKRAREP